MFQQVAREKWKHVFTTVIGQVLNGFVDGGTQEQTR